MVLFGSFLICTLCGLNSCTKEPEQLLESNSLGKRSQPLGDALLRVRYEVETTTTFNANNHEYSDMDIAFMTPSRDLHKVSFMVFENGKGAFEIEVLDVTNPISIAHSSLSDDSPKIKKISVENDIVSFYAGSGKMMYSGPFEIPDLNNLVQSIKCSSETGTNGVMNHALSSLLGVPFIPSVQDFIDMLSPTSVKVQSINDQFITIRFPFSDFEPSMKEECVVVIETRTNLVVGVRVYDSNEEVLLSSMFAYESPERPLLKAIKQQVLEKLPSGVTSIRETITKIDRLSIEINN